MTQHMVYQCPLCHKRVDYEKGFGPEGTSTYCKKHDKYVTMERVWSRKGFWSRLRRSGLGVAKVS